MAAVYRSIQKDRGYAWVILASSMVMRILIDGFWTSLGVIFVQWKEVFNSSAAEISSIGSILMLTILTAAPLSSALAYRLTSRVVVVGAGIIITVGFFAASFVTEFWQLYIVTPFLGVAMGIAFHHGWSYYIFFFDKHFALVKSLTASTGALGMVIVPSCMEQLITWYGWRGAFQITSAIMAHVCICGLLLREPVHLQKIKKSSDVPYIADRRIRTKLIIYLRKLSNYFDLSLFRNVRFIVQSVINGSLLGVQMTSLIFLVPYAVTKGLSVKDASFLMTCNGATMTLVRLTPIGLVVDKQIISASRLGGVMNIASGILIMVIPFISKFEYLMVVSGIYGVTQGIGGCMTFIISAESPGLRDKGSAADAWFLLSCGIGATVCIYLFGFLLDVYGTYTLPMAMCATGLLFMGFTLLSDPCLIRWHKRRTEESKSLTVIRETGF